MFIIYVIQYFEIENFENNNQSIEVICNEE